MNSVHFYLIIVFDFVHIDRDCKKLDILLKQYNKQNNITNKYFLIFPPQAMMHGYADFLSVRIKSGDRAVSALFNMFINFH